MHQLLRKTPANPAAALDKYYTKKSVVKRCLKEDSLFQDYDLVVEPAAGNGNFWDLIRHPHKVGMDIAPEHRDIKTQDWFSYMVSWEYASVLVIGNPPFGRYHTLSKRFIEHALLFPNVRTIAFVLPNVYKKHTRQRIIPPNWRIKSIVDLGKNPFTLNGKDYHIDSSFFVIDRSSGEDLRAPCLSHVVETEDFVFANGKDYDLFVFGASPRKILGRGEVKTNNRGYFLKAKTEVNALVDKIKSVPWQGSSCANGGVFWLNKTEFITQYNAFHGRKHTAKRSRLHTI